MVIKALVFDIGGVLLDETGKKSREILSEKFGIDKNNFEAFVKENLKRAYYGKISGEEFFKMAKNELNINASVEELISSWLDARRKTTLLDEGVLKIINDLREKGYLMVCLSDTTKLNDTVRNELGVYDSFDELILSVDENCWKPEEEIYRVLIKRLSERDILPEESVFIDDRQENLFPAERIGVKTLLFKGSDQLRKDLTKLGFNI